MTEYLLYSLLGKDPAFEEAVQHPKLLAIMEYFLGTDCVLNNCVSFIKKGGEVADEPQLGLHIDPHGGGSHGSHNALMQLSPYPDVFNSAWCLTDYTLENGAIVRAACFVLSPVARGVALTRKAPVLARRSCRARTSCTAGRSTSTASSLRRCGTPSPSRHPPAPSSSSVRSIRALSRFCVRVSPPPPR